MPLFLALVSNVGPLGHILLLPGNDLPGTILEDEQLEEFLHETAIIEN